MTEKPDPRYIWYKINLLDPNRQKREYLFRGLTRREGRIIQAKEDLTAQHDYILCHCVYNLDDPDDMLAGSGLKICSEILRTSGLTEEFKPQQEASEWMESLQGSLEAAAVITINGLDLEALDTCDPAYYHKYLGVGRMLFYIMFQKDPIAFFTGQEDSSGTLIKEPGTPTGATQTFTYKSAKKHG